MRKKGKIVSWNDEKGYGFIVTPMSDERVFVHINEFANRARRPAVGDSVTYSLSKDARGRTCAGKAVIAGLPSQRRPARRAGGSSQVVAIAFLALSAIAASLSYVPAIVPWLYLGASILTYVAYALDKAAARNGNWRTSETTLHVFALAGGWPGALIAQSQLRHKTRKQPFRAVFWLTVLLNCAALIWLLTPDGRGFLGSTAPTISWSHEPRVAVADTGNGRRRGTSA